MKRDWDKLNRQARHARGAEISRNAALRRRRRAQERKNPKLARKAALEAQRELRHTKRAEIQRLLTVYSFPSGNRQVVGVAVFTRVKGQWRCPMASPQIEWMTRVVHVELIEEWIRNQGYHYAWTTLNPEWEPVQPPEGREQPHCRLHSNQPEQTEESPADSITRQHDSLAKNDTLPDQQRSSPASGSLERNGLANPRRLMPEERSSELTTTDRC